MEKSEFFWLSTFDQSEVCIIEYLFLICVQCARKSKKCPFSHTYLSKYLNIKTFHSSKVLTETI